MTERGYNKPMILFINGSINAGKSTVAKLLADKIGKTALLEIDAVRDMVGWMPIDEVIPLNLENAVSLIRNFSKARLNVVVPYPLSQKNYEYITNSLGDLNDKIYFFTLSPRLENAITNRGTRELTDKQRERIKYHYKIGIPNPAFGEVIDNSEQTPEETANIILGKLK